MDFDLNESQNVAFVFSMLTVHNFTVMVLCFCAMINTNSEVQI